MRNAHFGDDSRLVKACLDRDFSAWSSLIGKYSALIRVSIEKRLKMYGISLPPHDIEDIRQNMLSAIWKGRKLGDLKNRENISYWLSMVSGNMAIEYIRHRRKVEPVLTLSLSDKIGEKEIAELIPSGLSSPSDALIKKEMSETVSSAIEKLPSKEKLIIKLNILHDKKYQEIAEILNLPDGTVASYVKRAKERLRKYLKDLQ